jgi:purine-binding chemotaxis protein CheW
VTLPALVLPVGIEWYAVALTDVREVVAGPLATPAPTAPGSVLGLFNLRGEIVPLFDTAEVLGVGRVREPPFAVVVETGLGPAGLAASGLPESADLAEPLGPAETPGTVATYPYGDGVVTLLDVEVLLAPARLRSPGG